MIIDYRERDLIPLCPPTAQTMNLPVADIWIGTTEAQTPLPGGVLIERKSVADLVASILDGRYREQRTRLMAYAQENQTNVMYVIEGDLSKAQRMEPQTLRQWLNRLQLRYKCAVVQTSSLADTAALCALLEKQFTADSTCFKADTAAVAYEQTVHVKRKDNQTDPKFWAIAAMQQCPGVSNASATKLYEAFGSFPKLFAASQDDLAKVQISKRALGKKVAETLWNCLHAEA